MKKVLLLNSDSPYNKGDQAILLGNISLIKSRWPDAEITAISNFRERDERWFQIKFINQKVYTISPAKILKISFAARSYDVVFWGGGELLKDYTTKIAPTYWLLRIVLLRLFKSKVYGLFQGIGPTTSSFSRWAIKTTVNLCETFFVRDSESEEKLISFGVDKSKIVSGYDPAILNAPSSSPENVLKKTGITPEYAKNSIIVGLRKWFHYRQGSWTPLYVQKKLAKHDNLDYQTYKENVVKLLNNIIEENNINVIFFPMFTSSNEGDREFSEEIAGELPKKRSVVLNSEQLSPQEMIDFFSLAKLTIATRLHSSIVSISSGTPAICLYYVDKGKVFFDQIDASQFCFPIEGILNDKELTGIEDAIHKLIGTPELQESCFTQHKVISRRLINTFNERTV